MKERQIPTCLASYLLQGWPSGKAALLQDKSCVPYKPPKLMVFLPLSTQSGRQQKTGVRSSGLGVRAHPFWLYLEKITPL